MKSILAATDGSEASNRAVDVAAALANALDAKLVVITVGDSFSTNNLDKLARASGSLGESLDRIANQILQKAKERAEQIHASSIEEVAQWGDTAEVILDAAKERHADFIVVGRRGRGRLAGLLMGSVSQKIASLAACPVVVVP